MSSPVRYGLGAAQDYVPEALTCLAFGFQGKTIAGPPGASVGGWKAPSSMGKISIAGVLRLRAHALHHAINL
jgi:hypothetical protein